MAEIIEFSKYRPYKSVAHIASSANPFTDDAFSPLEVADLQQALTPHIPATNNKRTATINELCNEAMEQAFVEMNGGPIDLSRLPPLPTPLHSKPVITATDVRNLRLMIEKTRDCLAEYLSYYKTK